jgi:ribosomal-protein-alanine N-acetyltransferase
MGESRGTDPDVPTVPTVATDRLWLRPWRRADAPEYARILHHPEVARHLGSGIRYRVKRAVASLVAAVSDVEARREIGTMTRHWQQHRFGLWAVEEKASGRLIGSVGLTVLDDWSADPSNVELGWLLARPSWGRGLGREAGLASLAYGFDDLRLPRIVSVTLVANARSERLIQRLGFSFVGRTRWKGSDVVWYAMDRSDWEGRRHRTGWG